MATVENRVPVPTHCFSKLRLHRCFRSVPLGPTRRSGTFWEEKLLTEADQQHGYATVCSTAFKYPANFNLARSDLKSSLTMVVQIGWYILFAGRFCSMCDLPCC